MTKQPNVLVESIYLINIQIFPLYLNEPRENINIWGHYKRFISSYPLINGFCQDSWHIGVDRDWRECKDRQFWVEIVNSLDN